MIKKPQLDFNDKENPFLIGVSISNKHLHLSGEAIDILFGVGYQLTAKKALSQPAQFAAEETVTLIGPKGNIDNLRIIGPARTENQIELAQTDARKLGIAAPLRNSGDSSGSAPCILIGPKGQLELQEGVIISKPHIHLSPTEASELGLHDGDYVDLYFEGVKSCLMFDVLVRSGVKHCKDIHIDTDEANAMQYVNGQKALVLKHD